MSKKRPGGQAEGDGSGSAIWRLVASGGSAVPGHPPHGPAMGATHMSPSVRQGWQFKYKILGGHMEPNPRIVSVVFQSFL